MPNRKKERTVVNEEKSITSRKKGRERENRNEGSFVWIQVDKRGWKTNVNHRLEDEDAADDCACSRA